MKKLLTVLAIALFTIGAQAQDAKPAQKQTAKKESCCAKKTETAKKMTTADIEKCKAKCKAEGKTCNAVTSKKEKKSCCAKA